MQKVEKMRLRMSSAVVTPVMSSRGRRALWRSISTISCGIRSRMAFSAAVQTSERVGDELMLAEVGEEAALFATGFAGDHAQDLFA